MKESIGLLYALQWLSHLWTWEESSLIIEMDYEVVVDHHIAW
jgi:hypothetical protein